MVTGTPQWSVLEVLISGELRGILIVVRYHPMHKQTRRSTELLFHEINRIAGDRVGAGRSSCLSFSLLKQAPGNEYKLVAYNMRLFSISRDTIDDHRA